VFFNIIAPETWSLHLLLAKLLYPIETGTLNIIDSDLNKAKLLLSDPGPCPFPIIIFKREGVEKNRELGNKLDGNNVNLFQVFEKRYSKRNQYDKFNILNNRIPQKEFFATTVPDYVTLTYNCIIFTDYVEQNNKIIEAIEFASDSYWGDPSHFKFRSKIDSFSTTTLIEQGSDRACKTSFTLTLFGYIIPDSINKYIATDLRKYYSKSQLVFTLETVDSIETSTIRANGDAITNNILTSNNIQGGGNVNQVTIPSDELAYLSTVPSNKTANSASTTLNTATFNNTTIYVAPSSLPPNSVGNFAFYINTNYVSNGVLSFIQSGTDCVVTFDTSLLGFTLDSNDTIIVWGKFS